MGLQGDIFLVTSDRSLAETVAAADQSHSFGVRTAADLAAAEAWLSRGLDRRHLNVLVLDLASIKEADGSRLARLQEASSRSAVFYVRPEGGLSPDKGSFLREVSWPLPAPFVDEVAASGRPIVFLVDKPIFKARAMELSFTPTGLQPVMLQKPEGIAELLQQSRAPLAGKDQGLYDRLMGGLFGKGPAPAGQPPAGQPPAAPGVLGHVVAALFEGGQPEAVAFDQDLRVQVPGAVCYRVSNADPIVAAVRSLEAGSPVYLERKHAKHIVPMLTCSDTRGLAPLRYPILLMDRDAPKLAELARTLLADGYNVEMAKDEEEVLRLCDAKGRFHVVVIGVSFAMGFTFAVDAGPNLAVKLHEIDPDARFIFMLDLYPLERAVREMSRVVELGADDAILKPVEPARLVVAVDRSLKRRAMMIEQARTWVPAQIQVAFGPSAQNVNLIAGRYEMVAQIGEGGMGLVFLATDRQLARKVALKKMRSEIKSNAGHREKFIQEARLVSRLVHPYIVGVHDIVEHRGEIYLVLDYVDGKPLSQILQERGRMPLADARRVMEQVCEAVEYAHQNGILHRDLKPSNVMIGGGGYAKVMDFGLAREFKDAVSMLTQKEGAGTLAYMAPEQHLGKCGMASDVYALGVCLYEMLAGERPFKGPDFLAQKERLHFAPLSSLVPGLPPGVDGLMARVLAPDPHKRFPDARSLSESFKAV